ncbi:hypothetical protein NQZ68_017795, partial [Dissostichus eleginoides]
MRAKLAKGGNQTTEGEKGEGEESSPILPNPPQSSPILPNPPLQTKKLASSSSNVAQKNIKEAAL